MRIEPMNESHIDGVMEIENECFIDAWSRTSMLNELKNKFAYYVAALDGDKVIGYGGMWHAVNEGYITNIAVHSEYRHQGVGSAIIEKLSDIAKEKEMIGLTLEVRVSNEPAINLYRKLGFRLEGIRKEYYEDREDAYIMWKYFTDITNDQTT